MLLSPAAFTANRRMLPSGALGASHRVPLTLLTMVAASSAEQRQQQPHHQHHCRSEVCGMFGVGQVAIRLCRRLSVVAMASPMMGEGTASSRVSRASPQTKASMDDDPGRQKY